MPSARRGPRIRQVVKVPAPYPLNQFPGDFAYRLGKEIIYHLLASGERLEGEDWEEIFARCIGADWRPSNVGLDDVRLGQCAWGAKTLKVAHPESAQAIRLISGRNSTLYSFNEDLRVGSDANGIGPKVLEIWNARVTNVRAQFGHVRTVVLMKGVGLRTLGVFEFDTLRYEPELFTWEWNRNNNLEGFDVATGEHKFTWQPHGSQFTVIEPVPADTLLIRLRVPKISISEVKEQVLKAVGFDRSWVEVAHRA